MLFRESQKHSLSKRNNFFTSQSDVEIHEIEKRCRRNDRVCRFDNRQSKKRRNFDEYLSSSTQTVKTIMNH